MYKKQRAADRWKERTAFLRANAVAIIMGEIIVPDYPDVQYVKDKVIVMSWKDILALRTNNTGMWQLTYAKRAIEKYLQSITAS